LEEVASQKYPLSRYIFIYVNKRPGKPLDPKLVEFVKFALSREGQQDVVKDGIFLPLPAEDAKRQLAKLK
jgi:phosphate transport system substrate-binding protein